MKFTTSNSTPLSRRQIQPQTRLSTAFGSIGNADVDSAVRIATDVVKFIPGGEAVAGVIAKAGQLVSAAVDVIDKIFGTSQDKADREAAGRYQEVNSQYLIQIRQVDNQIALVSDGLKKLGQAVGINGLAGLGDGASELNNAIGANTTLQKALNDRIAYLQALIKRFYQIVDALTGKSNSFTIPVILGSLGLICFVMYLVGNKD
jgi:hypothetical protein